MASPLAGQHGPHASRWIIAAASVLVHLCLGSVYAWSVFIRPLRDTTGWSEPQVTWAFSIAIAALGITAALGSGFMQRIGPRRSVMLSAILLGIGYVGAGVAARMGSPSLMYALFGVVGGMGLGMGYAPPVTTLLRWFPDRRGLATGLAVSGFGLGALVAAQLAERLLGHYGCSTVFTMLGVGYAGLILLGSLPLRLPPEGWSVAAVAASVSQRHESSTSIQAPAGVRFWLLWGIFFLNICAGILLVALAKPMAEEVAGLRPAAAGWVVAIMGLFNGGGRLGWSIFSDRLGRLPTFAAMLALQIILFVLMVQPRAGWLFVIGLWFVISCYGGGFALTPAAVADLFGSHRSARLYGVALTAWSAAALLSPPLGSQLRALTGSYVGPLYAAAGMLGVGFVLTLALIWLERALSRSSETAIEEASHCA